jgi:hypothetical protein
MHLEPPNMQEKWTRSMRLAIIGSFLVLGWLAGGGSPVQAANEIVTDCSNETQLRTKLTAMQSSGGGTLTFACGSATIVLTAGQLPTITKTTIVDGGGKITLSGGNSSRLFYVSAGAALTLKNLTVTRGFHDGDGGAIRNDGTLTIINCTFFLNETTLNGSGGAIVSYGPLNIANSAFHKNKAANGGALFPRFAAAVTTITGSSFYENETSSPVNGWGGAMLLWDGAVMTMTNSSLTNNSAQDGGAVFVHVASHFAAINSTIADNVVGVAGNSAINSEGYVALSGVTVSGNAGMGIYNRSIAVLTNVTLSGNGGSGIRSQQRMELMNVTAKNNAQYGIHDDGPSLVARNLLLVGNFLSNCAGPLVAPFSLSTDGSCGFGAGRDSIPVLLPVLANNGGPTLTHLPPAGSAAIDNGSGVGAPAIDQRGFPRPAGGAVDVGAVEVQPPTATPTKTPTHTPTRTNTRTPTTVPNTATATRTPVVAAPATRTPTRTPTVTVAGTPQSATRKVFLPLVGK